MGGDGKGIQRAGTSGISETVRGVEKSSIAKALRRSKRLQKGNRELGELTLFSQLVSIWAFGNREGSMWGEKVGGKVGLWGG